MILSPEQYSSAPVRELLSGAARGYVPLDHRFLRAILERGESVLPELLEFLKEPREDDRMETDEVLLELARHLRTPSALPFLCEVARISEFSFPDGLTEAFVDLGAASVEPLFALHEESEGAPDTAFALAALGVRDARILELLTARLNEDPSEGALLLGLYGDPAAKPALEEALGAAGDNARLRQELESAIADGTRQDTTEPEPFDIFPLYPEQDSPYFAAFDPPELLEFLKSPVGEYRASAVKMLTFEDPPPQVAGTVFDLARQDPDAHVRATAWESLEGVHEPPEIEQALRAKVADQGAAPVERAAALVALAHEAEEDEALRRLIEAFYEQPETRAQAVKAMWHSGDRRFEKSIAQAFDDTDVEVRRQAVTAAGVLGMVAHIGRIERLFEDETLRSPALYAYALAAPSASTPAHLRKLFRKIEDLAGGLDEEESLIVSKALDDRLEGNGYKPMFFSEEAWEHEHEEDAAPVPEAALPAPAPAKPGRNDPCPCGSGKKYKKCCGA
ncbi:MAG TPA: HEAT repeat domain-containing protein [Bryobacteraceae bacterium]|nr:HEAT repeat domain-containing protein [Bryobacteraceae bacterium]